jgi:hypothetical protein
MDTQPTPSNPTPSPESRPNMQPEDFAAAASEQVARPEVSPAPGSSPAPQASPPANQSGQHLSAADVAAAIAAVPTPSAASAPPASLAAADVDVIEPEWVAKAEEVVRQHEGDPYGEEEAVEELQRDYLQKRYGHAVADPDAKKPEAS